MGLAVARVALAGIQVCVQQQQQGNKSARK
jgi:hypothetical protein